MTSIQVNQECLDFIESRKGFQVITEHRCALQPRPRPRPRPSYENQNEVGDDDETPFKLVHTTSTKNVNDILSMWRYTGEPMRKETIAMKYFIQRSIVKYADLERLNDEYGELLHQYSRVLADTVESREAVQNVLYNMELLQVTIGSIHSQTLDVVDPETLSDAIVDLEKDLCKTFQKFQSKISEAKFCFQAHISDSKAFHKSNLVSFHDHDLRPTASNLTCKHTLSAHEGNLCALKTYTINADAFTDADADVVDGKQYLASAGEDQTIKLWDLSNNTVTATLTGHQERIRALEYYTHAGAPMLASASYDKTIRLWNLSNPTQAQAQAQAQTQVQTLSDHDESVYSLAVYKQNSSHYILISGSEDCTIKLWNLDNHSLIATLHGHEGTVRALSVYNDGSTWYLASGSDDECIKIWNLDTLTLVHTITKHPTQKQNQQNQNQQQHSGSMGKIHSLLQFHHNGKKLLASADVNGTIQLYCLDNYECIRTINNAHSSFLWTLDLLQCDDKLCLVSAGEDKAIKIWDLDNYSEITTLHNDEGIVSMKVFMNNDQPCLATADNGGRINLWMT